jgi:hypothetical protein
MMRRPYLMTLLFLVAVISAACGGSDGERPQPPPVDFARLPDGTTATPAARRSLPATPPFLVESRSDGARLRPIDPATASDIPGFQPIAFSANRTFLSPDRRMLAALVSLYASGRSSNVRLIDLESWSERTAPQPVSNGARLVWSQDGETLYAFEWADAGTALVAFDRATLVARNVMTFDLRLAGTLFAIPGTTEFVALGYRVAHRDSDTPIGDAFLAFIDPMAAKVAKELPLPGLMVGQWPDADEQGYSAYSPAAALSPDGARIYIAHAESERITVVDTRERAIVDSREPMVARPWWRRFASRIGREFVATAEAKGGGNSGRMTAAVSPDGRYLHVAGEADERCPDGPWHCVEGRPLGLRTIDTSDLRVVMRDEAVAQFALSDDGAFLVGAATWRTMTWRDLGQNRGQVLATEERKNSGVRVYSARSGEHLATLELPFPAQSLQVVIAPGTRYALLDGQRPFEGAAGVRSSLAVLDLDRLAFTARRDFAGGTAWIVPDPATNSR